MSSLCQLGRGLVIRAARSETKTKTREVAEEMPADLGWDDANEESVAEQIADCEPEQDMGSIGIDDQELISVSQIIQ